MKRRSAGSGMLLLSSVFGSKLCTFDSRRLTNNRVARSLKNHGAEAEVEALFSLGKQFMDLPLDEKMVYEEGDDGMQFGYAALSKHTERCY